MGNGKRFKEALAVDPTTRGFAFAILERRGRLVDWGGKKAVGPDRNTRCARELVRLIRIYRPDVLVLENCTAYGSRRCSRIRLLLRHLENVAAGQGIPTKRISARFAREACANDPRATKHAVARALVARFPELARKLPPPRKPWMTEDGRINIFDAVGLAVAAFQKLDGPRSSSERSYPGTPSRLSV